MKKTLCIVLIILIAIGQSSGWSQGQGLPDSIASPGELEGLKESKGLSDNSRVLKCLYYDEKSFYTSFESDTEYSVNPELSAVFGGILPHHLVASPMIAGFFTTLRQNGKSPLTIIVLGPNHKRVGDKPIHTGSFSWDTPFGVLEADKDMAERMIKSLGAGVNPELLEEEHSISGLIPYIKYCFPSARVVPVLIHGNMKRKECAKLSSFLVKEAKGKPCLVLASVDFSHGLKTADALKRDEITRKVIDSRDYDTLFGLDNTYLDAPPTLAAFLMTMDGLVENKEGQTGVQKAGNILLKNSEASEFLKQPVPGTTSYMTYIFGTSGDGS